MFAAAAQRRHSASHGREGLLLYARMFAAAAERRHSASHQRELVDRETCEPQSAAGTTDLPSLPRLSLLALPSTSSRWWLAECRRSAAAAAIPALGNSPLT